MNPKVRSALDSYRRNYSLPENLPQDLLFEYLAAYCSTFRFVGASEDPGAFSTGKAFGIDAIIITIDDQPVRTIEEAKHLFRNRSTVTFNFLQAKTSDSIDLGETLKFIQAVGLFFDAETTKQDSFLAQCRQIVGMIFENFVKISGLPSLKLLYSFPGDWAKQSAPLAAILENALIPLRERGTFSEVILEGLDGNRLFDLYRQSQMQVTCKLNAPRRVTYPPARGVKQAIMCLLSVSEYLHAICAPDGSLLSFLYNENVRDFLGTNVVNDEIAKTLTAGSDLQDKFGMLNNGVTIVARSMKNVSDDIYLEDYQIVNGCQTSNVIYNCRDMLSSNCFVAVRLIETEDSEVVRQIVRATNRQTPVTEEAFLGLSDYQKSLEAYYEVTETPIRLFYERRARQYSGRPEVSRSRVVTMARQVQSFVSIFLEEPHSCYRYFGEVMKAYKDRMFIDAHSERLYYTSAALAHTIDNALWAGDYSESNQYRWHIWMLVGAQITAGTDRQKLQLRKYTDKLCDSIQEAISDGERIATLVSRAVTIIKEHSDPQLESQGTKDFRLSQFTQKLLEAIGAKPELTILTTNERSKPHESRVGTRCAATVEKIVPGKWGILYAKGLGQVWFSWDVLEDETSPRKGDTLYMNYFMGPRGWKAYAVSKIE